MNKYLKYIYIFVFFISIFTPISKVKADVINEIEINGNQRISDETIILFGGIKKNVDYNNKNLNLILKNLYETNFFENVSFKIDGQILKIFVIENPIVQSIEITGVKNKSIIEKLNSNLSLREKNSFIESIVQRDENTLKNILRSNGYYFSEINTVIEENENNTVDLKYQITLGEKAFIEKIKFIGDKKIKDRKLRNIIISEESKFWKFLSSKKYLDKNRIRIDENLLKNYYKNNGYYEVKVNSTSAQILESKKFELIYNINAGEKFTFNNLKINLPSSFDAKNFEQINKLFEDIKNQKYSLNKIKLILEEIDLIVLNKQYEFINATYKEKIVDNNKIDIIFNINESKKIFVEKINIFGNYVTNENVIRNSILTDEGDPFNEILFKKSLNRIKSRNIFEKVDSEILDGSDSRSKILNIRVSEKPTGEISAGAGTGTSGSQLSFGISENNYLGEGKRVKANATLSDNALRGLLSITDPNFKNSDKSLITKIENSQEDLMSRFGYKTNKAGFSFGTSFEQYRNIFFSPEISSYYESLKTSSKASNNKKKQEGDYFDTEFSYSLSLNKLNQNFQPTDGYRSTFKQKLPLYADDKSISNTYEFANYNQLGNDTVLSFKILLQAVNSIDNDVRISKRVFIPASRLRGFASGKIGPKDGSDYIGGNYGTAINLAATLPNLFVDLQNVDFSIFLDTANIFGVDYDSSLDSNKLRSSTGLAIDWFTPIGPLSFSFASPITKADTDTSETFIFRIGTTF